MNLVKSKEVAESWSDVHYRERRRRRRVVSAVFLFVLIAAFSAGVRIVAYSPLFEVKNIEITGNKAVSSAAILDVANSAIFGSSFWKRFLGSGNILSWPDGFSGDDLKFAPELKSVSVQKDFRNREIKVSVEERQPFGIWCAESSANPGCFWFDSDGIAFKKATNAEGSVIVTLDDYSQKNIGLDSRVLPDEFLANVFSVFSAISESGLRIKETRLNDINLQEVEVDTYDGPKIYFSLHFPSGSAAGIIRSLKEKSGFSKLQYVDFRVENRVYYK